MVRLTLNTLENSRRTLGRILREFHNGKMEERKFRAIMYGLGKFLEYWKLEKELDLEKRIQAIEEALDEGR